MQKVIPEFDTPGHTLSWSKLLKVSECVPESHKSGQIPDASIDPTYENNYIVMNDLLKGWQGSTDSSAIFLRDSLKFISEISELFIDEYIHLGGDEVPLDCWLRTISLHSNQLLFAAIHNFSVEN